ncbi:head GIN domain-containing protein [Hymenobacter psychrophilus]|uniref:Putative auto-transporter adhesin, head GIN domain n=1 Tax=Hymenobacter psychrophilus TaxID=651662 RepID=A0A1H3NJM3_9BACT|nr:head GIN domain-containing protein [Hymenobacter psychrophilus]SDY88635.1 Putative auto-transporter adhesin, head GIN domain [Hymenobacter psychrophilus]
MRNILSIFALWLLALVPALAQSTTETRKLASFQAIEVSNGIELNLTAGPAQRVEATAETAELLARLKTEVRNGVLVVSFEREQSEQFGRKSSVRNLRVEVSAPVISKLDGSSGAQLTVPGPYATDKLAVDLSSGASLVADFRAAALYLDLTSGSVATLTGQVEMLQVHVTSGGVFKGRTLQVATCEAAATSGGNIAVNVQKNLVASATSGGGISYSGSPNVSKSTSSGGSVRSR